MEDRRPAANCDPYKAFDKLATSMLPGEGEFHPSGEYLGLRLATMQKE